YEVLEVSPNANSETIEKIFRYLAHRHHPDVSPDHDKTRFTHMVDGYNILTNAESRAAYDIQYTKYIQDQAELVDSAEVTGSDVVDRHRMLSLFYAQRRRDMKNPGVGVMALQRILGCPEQVLDFQLWYLREKGWVTREENGLLSITAEGVEEIENRSLDWAKDRLITDQSNMPPREAAPSNGAQRSGQECIST
ncbi:MAG: J domain-containing protein, partial [Pirellulaceae bacterium]